MGNNMKRGRNQRRRQGVNPNRALDSNGPDVRIRGTAQQIYDKYLALARDATSAGDRVKAENYFQHAEHYFRVLRSVQGTPAPQYEGGGDVDADSDQPNFSDSREGRDQRSGRHQGGDNSGAESDGGDDESDTAPEPAPASAAKGEDSAAAGDEEPRKPRRRRPRRQPRDDADAEADAAPEPAAAS
jgi:hypothetical protein